MHPGINLIDMKNVTLSGGMPRRNGIGRFVENNSKTIVEIIAALFILLFLYTAINKSFDIQKTVNVIDKTPLISPYAVSVAWLIVIVEYLTSFLLFIPATRKAGLYSALALMTIFTGYIGYMKIFITKLPCSCGGVISRLSWTQHLLFNLVFILLGIVAILLLRNQSRYETKSDEKTRIVFT
jgi:hypothetical protein